MANQKNNSLYSELTSGSFNFIPKGIKSLNEIYEAVKQKYPQLCNDAEICMHHKKSSTQPEWKHIVRTALNSYSKKGEIKHLQHGYWEI